MKSFLFFKIPLVVHSFTSKPSLKSSLITRSISIPNNTINKRHSFSSTKLYAESGPPQYEKIDATIANVDVVGNGSAMLHIETDNKIDYKAGNVMALEIEQGEDFTFSSEKNKADASQNGGWMRGPYTVSRATDNSFDVLMKVVGDKSKKFASASSGTPVKFGGKFKVPIVEGVDKETTKRLVLLSTGVGVGPCIGAIEEAMKIDSFPPIELYASYRNEDEVIYADYLDSLGHVKHEPIITSKQGRISSSEENLNIIIPSEESGLSCLDDTHYHIIGNGQMVNEWKEGLMKAGVPESKVTFEAYFNHKSESDAEAIERIANVLSRRSFEESNAQHSDKKQKVNGEADTNTITFVTGNKKKLEEVKRILSDSKAGDALPFNISNQKIDLPELQGDPLEIAKEKCSLAAKEVGGAVITEDTSLCFNALNEMPGPYIKWFLEKCGHDGLNNMIAFSEDKSGYAQTVVGFCAGPGEEVVVFDGRTQGNIVAARGPLDFGWDPIFEPKEGGGKTYAEMAKEEKDAISHRSRAFAKLRSYLMAEATKLKSL